MSNIHVAKTTVSDICTAQAEALRKHLNLRSRAAVVKFLVEREYELLVLGKKEYHRSPSDLDYDFRGNPHGLGGKTGKRLQDIQQ